jgi:hypothetical protein
MITTPMQKAFIERADRELLAYGERASGTTTALLFDFLEKSNEHKFLARPFYGVLYRKELHALRQTIETARHFFGNFPETMVEYDVSRMMISLGRSVRLMFRNVNDYYSAGAMDGMEFDWMGFDSIGDWSDPSLYFRLTERARRRGGAAYIRASQEVGPTPGSWWVLPYFKVESQKSSANHMTFVTEDNQPFLEARPDFVHQVELAGGGGCCGYKRAP